MTDRKWKRRKIVVDRDFQFRYLMTWVLLTTSLLAGLVMGSLTVFLFLNTQHMVTHFIWVNALCAVVITSISMYYIVVHSHRIAGPAFRLERLIYRMAEGRRGFRIRLRRKDYLKHVASALNELMESLEKKEARVHELGRMIGELSSDGHNAEQVHELAGRVSRELTELCHAVTEIIEDGAED
ncbi:MAG: hypothetical protein AMS16_01800 [Planctomycetes bacterium DG_58]|nr:MAG: hypothetical protein AMS16_01800 [Planctomycetes bacterium DG_58]KPL02396.1 MAG: hypothetical protein AMK75_02815 [Planctomycetes bacterium SM23_65]